jgi:isocitrate/isopropylmalate dehydrogenase
MTNVHKIAVIPGDGIGRDVVKAAMIVVNKANEIHPEFDMEFIHLLVSHAAIEKYGDRFPQETRDGIAQCDAILFGASGISPVLGEFRRGYDLYANVRPIQALPNTDALHPDADFIIIREGTEGLYSRFGWIDRDYHVNLRVLTTKAMERLIRFAFEFAIREGRKKVTFTHKAKVLVYTDGAWLDMFNEISKEYPKIEAEDLTIDTCCMEVVRNPGCLDVVITENANGDLLSDIGAAIIGGLGYAYSGVIGDSLALFEPIHGTAEKYADKNIVNPTAAIMAAKFMFDYLGERETGSQILQAVKDVLVEGKVRTYHMGGKASTTDFAEAVATRVREIGGSEA